MNMLELVRKMEGQTDLRRREILLEEFAGRGWKFQVQDYAFNGEKGCNIVIDVNQDPPPTILLAAHYDAVEGSPGANDDASGVAVLIDAAEKLQLESLEHHVRIVLFDDEEPTQNRRTPLGSQIYVDEFGINDLYAVLNFELCGMGDAVGIWPVSGIEQQPLLKQITALIQELGIPLEFGQNIPHFCGDYLPFRKAGFKDSYCFTSFEWKERNSLVNFADGHRTGLALRHALWEFLRLPVIPKLFRHYHNSEDRSQFLSTRTLEMMSNLTHRIVCNMNFPPPRS
jgi:peptidase M28-like protein